MLPVARVLALLLCLLPALSHAGSAVFTRRWGGTGPLTVGAARYELDCAIMPDTQNYVTTIDPGATDSTRQMLLDQMVTDIIAWRPDCVLWTGDLTDSTGGGDQNTLANYEPFDDPNSNTVGLSGNTEWQRARILAYNRLTAAGLHVFFVGGNHDSGLDLERTFPKSEFLALPWARSAMTRTFTINGGSARPAWSDTSVADSFARSAIFQTRIGPVCVVGMPPIPHQGETKTITDVGGGVPSIAGLNVGDVVHFPDDYAYAQAQLGCGGSPKNYPTIILNHAQDWGGLQGIGASGGFSSCSPLLAVVHGHFTCSACSMSQQFALPFSSALCGSSGGLDIGFNFQETPFGNAPAGSVGGLLHTGYSWWGKWVIDPIARTSTLTPVNPFLGEMTTSPIPADYTADPSTVVLSFNWCTVFGGPMC